jgi:hypothetical protein
MCVVEECAMLQPGSVRNESHFAVAIRDKELANDAFFTLRTFEICTICGARFGIGYHGVCGGDWEMDDTGDLPRKLTEILARDHRQDRAHKRSIDLDL